MKKVALDRGHDMECPGVVKDGDGRSAGTNSDGGAQDAVAKTQKRKKEECEAVRYFERQRGAGGQGGGTLREQAGQSSKQWEIAAGFTRVIGELSQRGERRLARQ